MERRCWAECLQEVGVPAEQIIVFDRRTSELEGAGYLVNRDGPGVRCEATDGNYTAGWTIADTNIRLSDILLNCDALINIPGLTTTSTYRSHFGRYVIGGDSILMSFDPMAHDTIGMKIAVMAQATPWLGSAPKLGLGGKNLLGTILNPNRMHRNLP